jgi:hypothetical protein
VALTEIMQGIEQYRFSSELNVAAGTKAFRRGLREHDLVRRLAELAKEPATRVTVAKRVEELSQAEIDTQYENRFDAALSAYLMVLSDTAQPETVAKAASAAAEAPNCWWTVDLSRELLMHAVATGFVQAPAARHIDTSAILEGTTWREALRDGIQERFSQSLVSVNDDTARRILAGLRAEQTKAQIPQVSNVIVMPSPTEEGERVTWKPRGRNRIARIKAARAAASMPPRGGRDVARA